MRAADSKRGADGDDGTERPPCCPSIRAANARYSGALGIRHCLGLWLCLLTIALAPAAADTDATASPARVEAAFLRNFARYVSWPAAAFPDTASPWCIGILGPDPFGDVLDSSLQGRSEQGRRFEVYRAEHLGNLPPCQIVFLAYRDAARRRAVLAELKKKPVLSVSDAPDFLELGGVIRLDVGGTVRMAINLDQAKAATLTIRAQMLEVAHEVLHNGSIRRMR